MADYTRKGATIINTDTGESETHFIKGIEGKIPSINEAKKASRKLQASGNSMKVVR